MTQTSVSDAMVDKGPRVTSWAAEDRVYLVAQPSLTGTVIAVTDDGGMARVCWDESGVAAWYLPAELDWYTLPLERVAVDARGWIVAAVARG